jgi:hypothetical protein
MKKITALTIILLQSALVLATPHSSFEDLITKAEKQCPTLTCDESAVTLHKVDQISLQMRSSLQNVAAELANAIWPDTILEGPYKIENIEIRLDKVETVVSNDVVIGYRITYSNSAVYVDDEISGVIRESGFVSADFANYFRDEEFIADFVQN